MSTNFYAKHVSTEQEYKEMELALAARQLDKLERLIRKANKEYHIGMSAYGWQFMFVPHVDTRTKEILSPWEDTLESIKNYLSRDNVKIIDEYGKGYTYKQFFDRISSSLYHDKEKAINGFDYDCNVEKYPHKVPIGKTEYTTGEGLRFATDDDWC